jgi:hypothetical protein
MHRLPNWRKLIYHTTLHEGYFTYCRTSSVRLPKDTFHKGLSNFTIPEPPQLLSNPLLKRGTFGNTEYRVRVKRAVVMHEYTNWRTGRQSLSEMCYMVRYFHTVIIRHRHKKYNRTEALFVQLVIRETEVSVLQMLIRVCFRHAQKLSSKLKYSIAFKTPTNKCT